MAQVAWYRNRQIAEGYANGHALFAGEMLPRGVRTFLENCDDPSLAESLGAREGLYAALYTRRERISHLAETDIQEWASDFADLVNTRAIASVVRKATEATQAQHRAVRDSVAGLLLATLTKNTEENAALYAIVLDSLRRGKTEGLVAGTAMTALKDGGKQPTLDDLYTETYKVVSSTGTFSTTVSSSVAQQMGGMAGDVARELPTTSGHAHALIAAGVGAFLYLDHSIHRAYTDGQATSYRRSGTYQVNFLTVGDGKVCPTCLSIEAGNPYSITSVPQPPQHINCRCWLSPGGT